MDEVTYQIHQCPKCGTFTHEYPVCIKCHVEVENRALLYAEEMPLTPYRIDEYSRKVR